MPILICQSDRLRAVLCLAQWVLGTGHGVHHSQLTLRFRQVPASVVRRAVDCFPLRQAVTESQRAICSVPERILLGELPHVGQKEARFQ